MAMPTHITVTAPAGRLTPVHPSDGCEPGGALMYVGPGEVRRVRLSQTTRRAINRGDLIPCDMNGARVDLENAASARDIDGGRKIIAATEPTKGGKS